MDLRGDTLFPVDYGNWRVDPSRPFSLPSLSPSLPLSPFSCLHPSVARIGSPRVTMATRTGAAWWGLQREKGEEEREGSTCSPPPAAETLRESCRRDDKTRVHPQLPFPHKRVCPSASTSLSSCLVLSYLNPLLLYPAPPFLAFFSPQHFLPCNLCSSSFSSSSLLSFLASVPPSSPPPSPGMN